MEWVGFFAAAGDAATSVPVLTGGFGSAGAAWMAWMSKQIVTIKTEVAAISQRQHKNELAVARLETRACATSADVKELQQLLPRQVPTIKR